MTLNRISALWARTALVWFAIVVSLGLFMGISQRFEFGPSHAHIGVLGWLSSAAYSYLTAIAREARPGNRAPFLHWAAHNAGVAVMTGGLFGGLGLGSEAAMGVVPIGAVLIVLSVFWAVAMLWPRLTPVTD
ncbi:MAG TPA: hypothetical protein VF577_03490 [Allosphingosinicella sp.]|jgi:hypothetical protein